jgi:hypothetical protein
MYIPRGEIRGNFQAEQPALTPSRTLHVDVLETVLRGRQHYDRQVTSEDLPYPSSDKNGEEMTPEEEAEIERRLLRGHVPGYDFPKKTAISTKSQTKTKRGTMKITGKKVLREQDVLMIDKDCVVSSKWLRDYVRTVIVPVCDAHGVKVLSVKYNLSRRKGFHLRIHVTPVHAELANLLQFELGDDPGRVSKNRARIRAGLPNWDKLFAEENSRIRTIYPFKVPAGTRRTAKKEV